MTIEALAYEFIAAWFLAAPILFLVAVFIVCELSER